MRIIVVAAEAGEQIACVEVDGVSYTRSEMGGKLSWVSAEGATLSHFHVATAVDQFSAIDDEDRDPAVEIIQG
jgi:uncharacterized protein CbrC (UPF0167 family)